MSNTKKVILARPSPLMVDDMLGLISHTKYEPVKLSHSSELLDMITPEAVAVVISTAISSHVKEGYSRLVKNLMTKGFPGPIFITSFTNIRRSKIVISTMLKEEQLTFNLLSLEEASHLGHIDLQRNLILITKSDISDHKNIEFTQNAFKNIIDKHEQIKSQNILKIQNNEE